MKVYHHLNICRSLFILFTFINALGANANTGKQSSNNLIKFNKFKIKQGEYLGKDCFLSIKEEDGLSVINFAHRDFLVSDEDDLDIILGEVDSDIVILGDVYDSKLPFNPENVAGINVIYNHDIKRVEFGPAICNRKSMNLIRVKTSKNKLKIGCGNKLSRINVDLKLRTDKKNNLISFSFTERYNNSRHFLFLSPWRQTSVFNLKCKIKSK